MVAGFHGTDAEAERAAIQAEAELERAAIQAEGASAEERAVAFSWGRDAVDAYPKQRTAESFAEFAKYVCSHRAKEKGKLYFCAPFAVQDGKHHRSKDAAAPRRFLPLDVDYIPDAAALSDLLLALQPYRHFAYTTASHTAELPRLRVVLELSRLVDRGEGIRIGLAFQARLTGLPGLADIKLDATVYRAEQPCFGPLTGAEIYPRDRRMNGAALDVDALLANAPEIEPESSAADRAERIAHDDPRIAYLYEHGYVLDAPTLVGKLAIRCPNAAAHSSDTGPTSTVVLLPHFNGVTRPVIKCLHNGCATLTQDAFWRLAGYVEPGKHGNGADEDPADEAGTEDAGITIARARLAADWVETEQQPPPFIVEGLLPKSEAGSLVGPGGSSKSTLSLYESVHIILDRPLYGRAVRQPGVVLAVSKEDRAALIDYRLKQICRALHLSDADMRRVHKNFLRLDLRGDAFMLQTIGHERIPYRSGDVEPLIKTFAAEGIAFAWFDTASRFSTGEGNQEAAVTLGALTTVADGWQCAAQALHHVAQSVARTATVDMHASRGGTAFVDNGRFARQLLRHVGPALPGAMCYIPPAPLDPAGDLLRLHVTKLTGAKYDIDTPIWIERREWEFVYGQGGAANRQSREDRHASARTEQATTDDAATLTFISEHLERQPPVRLSQNALVDARSRVARGMSEGRIREAVGRLRLDGAIVDVPLPGKVTRGQRTFLAPAGWQEPLV
jgi:hypothetical protein